MKSTKIEDYIVKTEKAEWTPLLEQGVDTTGISIKVLRRDETGRPPSFLLKFEKGAKYPYHNHPDGEELFVLEGSCIIEGAQLNQGDYLYTPPNFKHSVRCIISSKVYHQISSKVYH